MRELLVRMKPDCFEDIIALVALFRPGPLQSGMVDDFIERKHGREPVVYPLPQLEPILSETYGVILYQEQVMKIAQVLGGYSLGQADLLRRAMGKKNPDEMAKQRQIFMEGAARQKIPEDKARHIFDLMEHFAGYGFNKSHSAAYALIAYQTAYLKAHFPQAFMAATLSCDMGNSDKVAALVADCRAMHIDVLPPDVNASDWVFMPEKDGIRFGLGAVKGVGQAAVSALVEARRSDGAFASLPDMLMRLPGRSMNKRMVEALIKAGAVDALVPHRHAALAGLAALMEDAARRQRERASGQSALFDVNEPASDDGGYPDVVAWGAGECLQHEREVLGFYLTGHPLEEYLDVLHGLADATLADVAGLADGARVVLPVGISQVRVRHSPRGAMAVVQVEDLHAGAVMLCYNALYTRVADILDTDRAMLVYVRVDKSREEPRLMAEAVALLDDVLPDLVSRIEVRASALAWDDRAVALCRELAKEYPGKSELALQVRLPDGSIARLSSSLTLRWNAKVRHRLEACFGAGAVRVQCRRWQPEVQNGSMRTREERRLHVVA